MSSLGSDLVGAAIAGLPRLSFPWQTAFEALLLRCRIHAQAVARATDRLAHLVRPFARDDLVAAAVVHDVGKLLLARIWTDFAAVTRDARDPRGARRARTARPRIRPREPRRAARRAMGFRLPAHLRRVGSPLGAPSHESATLVRLADTVVHHAHGDPVDRELMLRLAAACELTPSALREIVFDLPHAGGSGRRRAERSPLSRRETAILQLVAEGKRAGEIARDLHLTESTVRSHLHKTYSKLEVPDRAQAVLKATEMAWI